ELLPCAASAQVSTRGATVRWLQKRRSGPPALSAAWRRLLLLVGHDLLHALGAKKVSGMGNRSTSADRRGNQSGFRQLRVGRARVTRRFVVQLNAIGTLCGERDCDGDHLLLLYRKRPVCKYRPTEGPKGPDAVGRIFVHFLQATEILHIEHQRLLWFDW